MRYPKLFDLSKNKQTSDKTLNLFHLSEKVVVLTSSISEWEKLVEEGLYWSWSLSDQGARDRLPWIEVSCSRNLCDQGAQAIRHPVPYFVEVSVWLFDNQFSGLPPSAKEKKDVAGITPPSEPYNLLCHFTVLLLYFAFAYYISKKHIKQSSVYFKSKVNAKLSNQS